MNTPDQPPPDTEDLRGLARGIRKLFEIGAAALAEDAGPSELALRVTGHLGCELTAVVSVAEKFPVWEHVNLQRGVDAYLAAQQDGAEWFGVPGAWQRPHENLLSLIGMPSPFGGFAVHGFAGIRTRGGVRIAAGGGAGSEAASYGTAAVGPEENTEVVAGTEGVTASFIKEMIRRTVLVSLRAGERPPALRDAHFAEVLAEMSSERHALTRSLLGVGPRGDQSAGPEPAGRPAYMRARRFQ